MFLILTGGELTCLVPQMFTLLSLIIPIVPFDFTNGSLTCRLGIVFECKGFSICTLSCLRLRQ